METETTRARNTKTRKEPRGTTQTEPERDVDSERLGESHKEPYTEAHQNRDVKTPTETYRRGESQTQTPPSVRETRKDRWILG